MWRGCAKGMCACMCMCAKLLQLCPTLCDPMDGSPSGSFVHGGSPGKNTRVSYLALLQGMFLTQGLKPHLTSPALAGGFSTPSTTWEVCVDSIYPPNSPSISDRGCLDQPERVKAAKTLFFFSPGSSKRVLLWGSTAEHRSGFVL